MKSNKNAWMAKNTWAIAGLTVVLALGANFAWTQDNNRQGFQAYPDINEADVNEEGFMPFDDYEEAMDPDELFGEGMMDNNQREPQPAPRPAPARPAPAAQGQRPMPALGDRPTRQSDATAMSQITADGEDPGFVILDPITGKGDEVIPNFDFPDAEIMEVARAIQKLTGLNLIIGEDVRGRISILAPSPITVGDAWRAFLSALELKDYTIVPSGSFFKIIRKRAAKESAVPTFVGDDTAPDTDAFVTQVIPLRFINVEEISRNFRIFLSRDARIIQIEQTNTLIIMDTGSNVKRLVEIIDLLDVEGHKEVLEVIPVRHAAASDIARLIEQILDSQSVGAAPAARGQARRPPTRAGGRREISTSDGGVISQIIADERTNSLITLANAAGLRKIRELVKKLDRAVVGGQTSRIHVYYLQHANATEMAETLNRITSGGAQGAQQARQAPAGDPRAAQQARQAPAQRPQAAVAEFEGGIRITADPPNNALVISASQSDFNTLRQVIAKIDIPRDQVFVEAVIMELSINNIRNFSVNVMGLQGGAYGFTPDQGQLANAVAGNFNEFLSGVTGLFGLYRGREIEVTINDRTMRVPTVAAFINAIEVASNANVLSRPQIMTLDNETAEIQIKDNIPISRTTTNQGITIAEQDIQEVGLRLKITPAINRVTEFVRLDIDQTFSTPVAERTQEAGLGIRTAERSAVTKVVVRNGDTVAIGGLMRENTSVTSTKVPLLGDIPLLGWLFRSRSTRFDKTNLVLFLTPRIIKSNQDARDIFEEKLSERQEFIDKNLGGGDPHRNEIERTILNLRDFQEEKSPLEAGSFDFD